MRAPTLARNCQGLSDVRSPAATFAEWARSATSDLLLKNVRQAGSRSTIECCPSCCTPPIDCLSCGQTFARSRRDQRFCSQFCGDVARGQRMPAALPLRVCALSDCEAEFQPLSAKQRCCSETHAKRLWNRENPEPWNDRRRDNYHRRKALKAGSATGRPVRLAEIRERDGNRCHLCRKTVPDRLWPHPLSPSLDHVIPLSKGGPHDPDNVRLAHLRCNVEKGADGGNEQLLLIG